MKAVNALDLLYQKRIQLEFLKSSLERIIVGIPNARDFTAMNEDKFSLTLGHELLLLALVGF
jgi:hypothetical protein